jgi:hypothetical protein
MSYTHNPLGLYNNKILVWVSQYSSLSLSIFVGLSFLPPTPFAIIACYPFTSLILSSSYIINPYSFDGKR